MIDLKSYLFKIDVRAQKGEEKVFMRTACLKLQKGLHGSLKAVIMISNLSE